MATIITPTTEPRELLDIPVSTLVEHHENVRTEYDDDGIAELAQSIAANGLLQPLLVHGGQDGTYQLIAGHRRLRAIKLLVDTKRWKKTQTVPCMVRSAAVADKDATVLMLVENLQRTDLSPLDEARGYHRLCETHGWTQRDLAAQVGKAPSHIAKRVALLTLPVEAHPFIGTDLTLDQAYELSQLDTDDVTTIVKALVKGLSPANLKWELERAATKKRRRAEESKFVKAVAKMMIEPLTERPTLTSGGLRYVQHVGFENLKDYMPAKNHIQVWDQGIAKLGFSVYRKLTAKQLTAEEEKEAAERAEKDAAAAEHKAEWLATEATPHEQWEYEASLLEEAHEEAMIEFDRSVQAAFARWVTAMDAKTLGKLVLQVAIGLAQSRLVNGKVACQRLDVMVPEFNEHGHELADWQRKWDDHLHAWIGNDSTHALQAFVASWTQIGDDFSDSVMLAELWHELLANGVEKPTLVLPPEPWFDEEQQVWRTDVTPVRTLSDGSTAPKIEDFDDEQEYLAALDTFETAWRAEQEQAAELAA